MSHVQHGTFQGSQPTGRFLRLLWRRHESSDGVLTAVENGGAGTVSRRSKMAAHNRAGIWEGRIGATAPITPPFRERHRSAQRHGDLERDTT